MAYQTPNAKISVKGSKVFRGEDKSNGVLMMGDSVPHIETSYSEMSLDTTHGLNIGYVPFGNGLWYDDADLATGKYAKIYDSAAGLTTPKFAGIMKYEQGIATGFPMNLAAAASGTSQNGIMPHMKGTIIKRGFVWYKDCYASASGTTKRAFSDITRGMCLFVRNATGLPVLAKPTSFAAGKAVLADCTFVGTIEQIEPENESVLINIGFDFAANVPST